MQRRSLLDYIDDRHRSEAAPAESETAARLEQRLADLEKRLAATRAETPGRTLPEPPFATQIEQILQRQAELPIHRQDDHRMAPPVPQTTAVSDRRIREGSVQSQSEHSADFAKFVEAVHLIGQAANRFLRDPQMPRSAESDANAALAATLKETTAAFAAIATNLAAAAADMRRAAEMPRRLPEPAPAPQRQPARVDSDLEQLLGELDDLRGRVGAMMRRNGRWSD
jgi:hypothetical protein